MEPVLKIRDLVVEYKTRRGTARAVDHVSLDLEENKTLGLAGESGSTLITGSHIPWMNEFQVFKSNVDSIRLIFHQLVLRVNNKCNLKLIIKIFNLCYLYLKD